MIPPLFVENNATSCQFSGVKKEKPATICIVSGNSMGRLYDCFGKVGQDKKRPGQKPGSISVKNPLAMRVVQESLRLCREKPPMLS